MVCNVQSQVFSKQPTVTSGKIFLILSPLPSIAYKLKKRVCVTTKECPQKIMTKRPTEECYLLTFACFNFPQNNRTRAEKRWYLL